MTEDSATLFLDLASNFPQAEKSQKRHKDPTPKIKRQWIGSAITK